MGFFDSIGSIFNPSNFMGSKGNSLLDLMDPGNTFHTGASQRAADRQFQLEYDIANKNFEESKAQNAWNRNMQEQAFQYQKDLNALQMEREDTATARRVADLKAAGLSPTLAAGSAAAAAPMHAGSIAPVSPAQKMTPSNVKVQAAMFQESMMRDRMQLATTLMGNIANVAKTAAETQLLKAQTQNVTSMTPIDLKLKEQAYEYADQANVYKLRGLALDVSSKEKDIDLKNYDLILAQDEHAQNALNYFNSALDSKLKQADIDLKDREYILKSLAIEAATTSNAKLNLEYQNLMYDTKFYHDRDLPLGFNPGYGGLLSLGTMDTWQGVKNKWNYGKDFVSRIYSAAKKSAHKFTKGVFDFSQ